ncbi:stress-response A/B barrel domain-containing protein HS1-like [Iris pallida]|uniref:Stress-response A/B barrel domain-containing protein HS1-like n=1 Tax=Iris pallida TaxID=29817 RepID=A0AAX6G4Z6_IRIPA|nr:stress-response A/B barrel domain-containing protein HS1-like [Iris pallida]
MEEVPKSVGAYRHIILAKMKDDVEPEEFEQIMNAFANLPTLIPQIKSLHWGRDESVKNKTQGFTHIVEVTFDSHEDIAIYYDHPAHIKFAWELFPVVEDYLVINYKPTTSVEIPQKNNNNNSSS